MVERVLTYKKTIVDYIKSALFGVGEFFTFLSPKQAVSESHDFSNTKDYLFLAEQLSIKNHWHKETLAMFGTVLVTIVGVMALITSLLNTTFLVVVTSIIALVYCGLVIFKLYVVYKGFSYELIDFTSDEIAAITDDELPTYTVLLPLKYEFAVIEQIMDSMRKLDYPSDKIDMIAMVEKYDHETLTAIENHPNKPDYFRVETLEYIEPQTKPKTLNMVFNQIKGDFLVIYDAEIKPDADQMKKAYLGFKNNADIACFQTRLDHYNTDQNTLTRLFNIEFSFYYDYFLPGLQKLGFPIPLSGHSTHFRTDVLRKIGGWDPYNVAEDCDVGTRLYRYGYKTAVLNSVSQEEAVGDVWGWIKQRTRWMKGFMQTSIVHLRHPLTLKNELGGWKNFGAFMLTVPGTVLINFLNLLSWIVLLFWIVSGSNYIQSLYTQPILYISVLAFVSGMFMFTYLNLISAFKREKYHLVKYAFLTPVYWFLLAIASTRGLFQLITDPTKWELTVHGSHLKNK